MYHPRLARRSTPRRLLAALLVTLAVTTALPPPADAATSAPWGQTLDWGGGASHVTVGANATLRIDGTLEYVDTCPTNGFPDFVYATADVYIVPAGSVGDGATLTDVSGTPNTIIAPASGGYFIDEIIGYTAPGGTVPEGEFAVVYDECQNGTFEAAVDAVFDPALTVTIPVDVPPLPGIAALKSAAAAEAAYWAQATQDYFVALNAAEILGLMTGNHIDAIMYLAGTYAGTMLPDVKLAAFQLLLNKAKHYQGIANDPPDPAFTQPTVVEPRPELSADVDVPYVDELLTLAETAASEGVLAEALLHSLERYQGADAADDGAWALVHARAIRDQAAALADRLAHTSTVIDAVVTAYATDGRDVSDQVAAIETLRRRILATGFTTTERAEFAALGLGDAELDAFVDAIADTSYADWAEDWFADSLSAVQLAHLDTADALGELEADMGALITYLESQPGVGDALPQVDAGGPYVADERVTITFDASNTTSPTPVTSYDWDLDGDGDFDDATGVTVIHAYDRRLDGLVGVKVTNEAGWNVGYASVVVGPGNTAPTVDNRSPEGPLVDATVGSPVGFTATVSDADGDPVAVSWELDGESVTTGGSFTYTPVSGDVGIHTVAVVADDGHAPGGVTRHAWHVFVRFPDGDGDGFPSDVDCDDTDPEVRPGRTEVVGNGIDDDCNPETPDSGLPPTASFTTGTEVGVTGEPVDFTDTSTDTEGDLAAWSWDFGDGATSTEQHPQHAYATPGTYPVTLTVTDPQGGTDTATASIVVTEAPVAAFTADPTEPAVGEPVQFSDQSTDDGQIVDRQWDFGDGGTATGIAPQHTYTAPGPYTVTLTVTDDLGVTRAATQTVRARGGPAASFRVAPDVELAGAAHGGAVVASSGEAANGPAEKVIDGTQTAWQTPAGHNADQWVRVQLGSEGVIDRLVLKTTGAASAPRSVEVRVSGTTAEPEAFQTVATATLEKSYALQTIAFAPVRARYVELRIVDNHGGSNVYVGELEAWTRPRTGGVVSLHEGERAEVVDASYAPAGHEATRLLDGFAGTYWRTDGGRSSDQWVTIQLAGGRLHDIDRVRLQRSGLEGVKDFELRVSSTSADDEAFTTVLTAAATNTTGIQEFSLPAVAARYVQLRALTNHGSSCCLSVAELQVVTDDGRNVASGNGVGALVAATSGTNPHLAIDASPTTYWSSAAGAVTGQALTVLLAGGESHVIDRLQLKSVANVNAPRDFELRVSTTTDDPASFTTVFAGSLPQDGQTHQYAFEPTAARYAQLRLVDNHGGTTVRVDDLKLFSPQRGGATVAFDDHSSDEDGEPAAWAWDFGDGTTSTDQHPTHTYAAPGDYTVTLTVTDDDGLTDTRTATYQVLSAPTADFTWPAGELLEGTRYSFTDTTATPGVVVARQWTFTGASTTSSTAAAPWISFNDDGDHVVTLTSTDHTLLSSSVTKTVSIRNAPPKAHAGMDTSLLTDQPWKPTASATDPGTADQATLTCAWDFGDGSDVVERPCNQGPPTHTYTLPGAVTFSLTVTDKDGGVGTDTAAVTVAPIETRVSVSAVPGTAAGGRIQVVTRLWERRGQWPAHARGDWTPLSGPVTVSLGDETQVLATDEAGTVTTWLPLPPGGGAVEAMFVATPTHSGSTDTDTVPPSGLPAGDIVFVIDESGSMAANQAAIRTNIVSIAEQLGASVDFQMGLVGFGDAWKGGMPHLQGPLTDDVDVITEALGELSLTGSFEPGYDGVAAAVDATNGFREGAGACVVLVADETPQKSKVTREQALEAVRAANGVVLSIVGTQHVDQGYVTLATESGGRAFSIADFAKDPQPVLEAIVDICVASIQARPDLSVTIDDGRDTITAGATRTYIVDVSNDGSSDVTGVTAEVALPDGVALVEASDGGMVTDAAVTWPAVDLLAGESTSYTVTVAVSSPLPEGVEEITVAATVADDGSRGPDLSPANNIAVDVDQVEVITNVPPTVTLGGPAVADEGTTVTLTATAADEDGDPLTLTWTSTDGTLDAAGDTADLSVDDGFAVVEVTVTATDPDGEAATDTHVVVVHNVVPTATVEPAPRTVWGLPATFAGQVGDPSQADTAAGLDPRWTVDGDPAGGGTEAVHTFATAGDHVVRLSATDKDGATGHDELQLEVHRRETSLTWTGEDGVYGFTTLAARLADDVDTATARLAGRRVTFTVAGRTFAATTDAAGVATVTPLMPIPTGTHTVTVAFDTDTDYHASTTTGQLTVTDSSGKVTGGALAAASGGSGGFTVQSDGGVVSGNLQWQGPDGRLHASEMSSLGVAPDKRSAWFSGVGRDGTTVVIHVIDGGEPSSEDRFRLWIDGRLVTGSGVLTGGNLQIH